MKFVGVVLILFHFVDCVFYNIDLQPRMRTCVETNSLQIPTDAVYKLVYRQICLRGLGTICSIHVNEFTYMLRHRLSWIFQAAEVAWHLGNGPVVDNVAPSKNQNVMY